MIVATVEIWPYGVESRAHVLRRVEIANVGGNDAHGNYGVRVFGENEQPIASGSVRQHARHLDVLRLVRKALKGAGY